MHDAPLTSIVILTRNGVELTRACLDSIARCTPEPHELVLVDNGSSDGTLELLRATGGAHVIDNGRNVGFGGGCNQGIAASRGERILLLNNDVVVTPGWLAALHRALDVSSTRGLVGPVTNNIGSNVQRIANVGYDTATLDGLDTFAAEWCHLHRGETESTPRLVGYCLLIDRPVIDRIGGFDLRYGVGNFEDDDLSLRAVVAGWKPTVVRDSFIHHVGSATFSSERIDYRASMQENFGRFRRAWNVLDADLVGGGIQLQDVASRWTFDPQRHYAPLVATPDMGGTVTLDGAREMRVAVCCDRDDTQATDAALRGALTHWSGSDDVTIAVRIDPRDTYSAGALEREADAIEACGGALPDVTLVAASDENDEALLRACTHVAVTGRRAWSRAALGIRCGCEPVALTDG